jgi:trimeric autotransporter adhesin
MQQLLPNTYPAGAANPCPACPAGFRYLVSNGRSVRHAGQFQIRRRLSGGFTATAEYTLAKAMDNVAAFGGATLEGSAIVQNWLDPEAEYARSNFDQRHLVTASVEYTTGSGTTGGTLIDGWKGRLVKDWTFTANLSSGSGLPLTPVYFAPVGGTGIIGSLRPDVTGIANDPPAGAYANRAAFAVPAPGQWGNAARNSITGPATFTMNAAVARTFRIGNRLTLDWRIDATNILNRVTYGAVNTLIASPQFGMPNRANDMRKLRSSIRVRF